MIKFTNSKTSTKKKGKNDKNLMQISEIGIKAADGCTVHT